MIYNFPVTITDVFERKLRKHVSGAGPEAIFTTDSDGWYIQLENMISIYVGKDDPLLRAGQKMVLKLERSQDASPNR